jgi:hypothetical protein
MTTRQHELWRQSSLNHQHAICDAHPELEHCRPSIRKFPRASDVERGDYASTPSSLRQAANMVARRHRITTKDLIGRSREQRLVEPRKDFIMLCRTQLGKSFGEIALFMDGRDHTSILHYYQLAQADLESGVAA